MYVSSDVADRIKLLAKSRGIALGTLLKDAGLGNNTMSNFKTSMPKCDTLAKIADCLCCSVDYLLGRSTCVSLQTSSELSDDEKWVISKYRELDTDGIVAVRGVLLEEQRRMASEKGTANTHIG